MPPTTVMPTTTPPNPTTTVKPTTTPPNPTTTVKPTTPPSNPTTTTPPKPTTTTVMPTTTPPNPTPTVMPTTTPPNPTTTVMPTTTTVMPTTTTVMPTTTTTMPTTTTTMPTTTTTMPTTTTTMPTTTTTMPTTTTTMPTTTTTMPTTTTTMPTTTTTMPTTTTTMPTTTTTMPTTTTTMPTTTTTMPTTTTTMPTTTSAESSTTATSCSVTRAYCPDCGVAQVTADGIRIVNGTAAAANEYPYQVIIASIIDGFQYTCGGSIIKKRWILTAAHCFFDRNRTQAAQNATLVGYGSSNLREITVVTATRYILHENYTAGLLDFDIALIELPSDLNYESDATIQPICLAEESDIVDGGKAVATGWGDLQFNGTSPDDLQEVVLDIISTTQCQNQIRLPSDTSSVVCALTAFKGTCQGDSGGPLVVRLCPNRWAQIGIVSYSVECARPEYPTVYTRVPSYRTWIDTNTGSSTTC
ncbi:serine proteinase stubble-like [Palaemon carinicauda]|uniref:serine proteinase stubble-like n=1 Tax=Palaemon carinicauda TaxID=392227 RepID=UPI0035B5D13F